MCPLFSLKVWDMCGSYNLSWDMCPIFFQEIMGHEWKLESNPLMGCVSPFFQESIGHVWESHSHPSLGCVSPSFQESVGRVWEYSQCLMAYVSRFSKEVFNTLGQFSLV